MGAIARESSDSERSVSSPSDPAYLSRTERVQFPERTQEELHPSNPWRISKVN